MNAPSPPLSAPLAPLSRGALAAMGLGVTVDGALTLALLAQGWTQGGANIAGWLVGTLLWLPLAGRGAPTAALPWASRWGWQAVAMALALGLRGGTLASALAWGAPPWLSVALGLALAWTVLVAAGPRGLARGMALPSARRWPAAAGALALAVVLLHLAYLKVFPLLPEEAYYWNYAARPALGYLDHPPMVAWLIAAAEALLGHGEAVVRLPALAAGVVMAGFVWALARRLVDPGAAALAAALSVTLPYGFFLASGFVTPDAPLAAAWAAALYFLHRALVGLDARAWVGVGVALGVGMLSKYTIALLGPAALLFCLADARARLVPAAAAVCGGAAGGGAVCAGGGLEPRARLGLVPLPGWRAFCGAGAVSAARDADEHAAGGHAAAAAGAAAVMDPALDGGAGP